MKKLFNNDSKGTVALEAIDHQTDSYARDIEMLFSGIIKDASDPNGDSKIPFETRVRKHPNLRVIEEKTFKRTGIKISILTNSHLAAIMPFYPNSYGIFVKESRYDQFILIDDQAKIMDAAFEHTGTVDLQKCKVTGIFSEYVAPMWLNITQLVRTFKMSSAEITAVFLHELGHGFSGCEYSNRLNSTNQILAELLRDTNKKKNLPRDYHFKELQKINPKTTQEQVDKMMNGKNIIMGPEAFRFTKDMIQSQMPENRYNENTFETLADNFAARWGYGEALTGALERLYQDPTYKFRMSTFGQIVFSAASILYIAYILVIFFKYLAASMTVLSGGTLAVGSLAAALGSGMVLYGFIGISLTLLAVIVLHSTHAHPMTYDDLKYRYQRVRNQYVDLIKDAELPPKQIKSAIDSIKAMDKLVADKKSFTNFATIVIDFLTPGSGKIDRDIEIQRLLEELSANDLYIKAASLRTA